MKATARAHPIQGIVKYHGMIDNQRRLPYHDSISLCTGPAATTTTVEFETDGNENHYEIDGEVVDGRPAERIDAVIDHVRSRAGNPYDDAAVRVVSENSFPTNVGLGSSSSGFAALAMALSSAADLELDRPEVSTIARRGSASAARSVTGGFSDLHTGLNDKDCRSHRIATAIGERIKVVIGLVPSYKETEQAHAEAADSHMFQARLAHVHRQLRAARNALFEDDFKTVFEIAEHDSLSLAATTMTGPAGWVYWQPKTLEIFNRVRALREEGLPVYFSTDTGASVYINTTDDHVERVKSAIDELGIETMVWSMGGPATILKESESLF